MSYDAEIVRELKKMNEFLEKMDWKLWNLHKKYVDEANTLSHPATPKPVAKDVEPVVVQPKYPTIETWE